MQRLWRRLSLIVAGWLLLLLVLLVHVQIVSYSPTFYQREFVKLDRAAALDTTLEQLARFSRHTTRYLRGLEPDPNVKLELAGQEKWFLNEREVAHMRDVQRLFALARIITGCGLVLLLALSIVAWRRGRFGEFCMRVQQATLVALLTLALAALLASQDFTSVFDRFHMLVFTNDLWLLNPAVDQLINLLPEAFFADAILVATVKTSFTLFCLLLVARVARFRPFCPK